MFFILLLFWETVNATESNRKQIDTNEIEFVQKEISNDSEQDIIDISEKLNQRAQTKFENNPRTGITNTLSADNIYDIALFSITSSKNMVLRFDSEDTNYVATLCFADMTAGTLTITNFSVAANAVKVVEIPAGDYAFYIHSLEHSVDNTYSFYINATNPSGAIKNVRECSDDLQYVAFEYNNGDIYSNGKYALSSNYIGKVTSEFNWERKFDNSTGNGYRHIGMEVYNVIPAEILGPTYYSSSYASSDNVMLINCGIGTYWAFDQSYRMNNEYIIPFTMVDVFDRKTPRPLDESDSNGEYSDFYHYLVYDINTGKVIDFFSPLNYYYATNAEGWPKNGLTTGLNPDAGK